MRIPTSQQAAPQEWQVIVELIDDDQPIVLTFLDRGEAQELVNRWLGLGGSCISFVLPDVERMLVIPWARVMRITAPSQPVPR